MINIVSKKAALLGISLFLTSMTQAFGADYPDTQETAQVLPLSASIQEDINPATDEDWFTFTLDQDDNVTFNYMANDGTVGVTEFVKFLIGTAQDFTNGYGFPLNDTNNGYAEESATLELTAGTYYIQVFTTDSINISGYQFDLGASSWTPDEATMLYCQDNPDACGIECGNTAVVIPMW